MAGTDTNKVTINVNGTDLEFTKIGNILGPSGKDGINGKSIYANTVDPWSVSGWNPVVAGDLFLNTTTGILWSAKAGAVTSNVQSNWTKVGELAGKITVDSALSSTSTNPVQNKVIKSALDGKAGSSHSHSSLTNSSGRIFNVPTGGSGGEQKTLVITDDLNAYQPAGNYASSTHDHDSLYQAKGNYVTTDTAQTITGDKTFSTIRTNSNIIVNDTNNDTHTYYKNKQISYIGYDSDGNIVDDYTYTLPDKSGTLATTDIATSSAAGLVKSSTTGTTSNRDYKVQVNSDGTMKVNVPWTDTNTTYSTATQSANGLMSASDKKKLDGIAEGANKITVDSSLSSTSTNPVQNKVIKSALDGKAGSSHSHSSLTNSSGRIFNVPTGGSGGEQKTLVITDDLNAYQPAGNYASASHDHTISDINGLQSALNGKLNDYGSDTTRPNGTLFTFPGGSNPVQMRSGNKSTGQDIGIFSLTDDNAFICNSSDNGYAFAVFDTDKTADFSTASNAAFAVLSEHAGVSVKGGLTVGGNVTAGDVSASGTSNRLTFRHLDGQNCNGDYNLYLQYHQQNSKIYLNGSTYYIENGYYYNGIAAQSNLINPSQNVTSTGASTWDPTNSGKIIWGQKFANSNISNDTGDLTLFLRPSVYSSGATELCMNIDGDYYSMGTKLSRDGHTHSKSEVGLGNVDNTADANKNVNYANSAGNADTVDGKHSSDFYLSGSNITNLPLNGGIYWNSYVESSSDGSDAASITVIKDGNGSGGTVLQIKQANDNNDIVNVVAGDLKLNGVSVSTTSHVDTYFPRAKYGNDSPYSDVSTSFIGGVGVGPRTNNWEFLYRAQHRNGAGDGPNYVMEMVSNLTSDSSIYWRKKIGGSDFTSFREIIDSNNIGSQSVSYATYATSSHLLRTYNRNDGSHGEDYMLKCRHNVDGNDRFKLQIIRSDGSVTHSTSVDYANSAGLADALNSLGRISCLSGTSRYDTGLRMHQVYSNGYPFSYGSSITIENGFGAEIIFNGLGGGGNTGSGEMQFRTHSDWDTSEWGNWRTVIDSSNIGSQNVNYANSAGSVAWGNISDKPFSNLSMSFSNGVLTITYK